MGRDATDKEQIHYQEVSQTSGKIICAFPVTNEELDRRLGYRDVWRCTIIVWLGNKGRAER